MNCFVHFSLPWNNSAQCCAMDRIWLEHLSISSDDPNRACTRSLSVILPRRECECQTRSLLLWDMTKHTVISKTHSDDIPIEKKALNRWLQIGLTSNVASSHNGLLWDTEALLAFSLIHLYSSQCGVLYYIHATSSPITPTHSPSGIHSLLISRATTALPGLGLMVTLKNSLPLLFPPPSLQPSLFHYPSPQEGWPTIDARGKQASLPPGLVETERTPWDA